MEQQPIILPSKETTDILNKTLSHINKDVLTTLRIEESRLLKDLSRRKYEIKETELWLAKVKQFIKEREELIKS